MRCMGLREERPKRLRAQFLICNASRRVDRGHHRGFVRWVAERDDVQLRLGNEFGDGDAALDALEVKEDESP